MDEELSDSENDADESGSSENQSIQITPDEARKMLDKVNSDAVSPDEAKQLLKKVYRSTGTEHMHASVIPSSQMPFDRNSKFRQSSPVPPTFDNPKPDGMIRRASNPPQDVQRINPNNRYLNPGGHDNNKPAATKTTRTRNETNPFDNSSSTLGLHQNPTTTKTKTNPFDGSASTLGLHSVTKITTNDFDNSHGSRGLPGTTTPPAPPFKRSATTESQSLRESKQLLQNVHLRLKHLVEIRNEKELERQQQDESEEMTDSSNFNTSNKSLGFGSKEEISHIFHGTNTNGNTYSSYAIPGAATTPGAVAVSGDGWKTSEVKKGTGMLTNGTTSTASTALGTNMYNGTTTHEDAKRMLQNVNSGSNAYPMGPPGVLTKQNDAKGAISPSAPGCVIGHADAKRMLRNINTTSGSSADYNMGMSTGTGASSHTGFSTTPGAVSVPGVGGGGGAGTVTAYMSLDEAQRMAQQLSSMPSMPSSTHSQLYPPQQRGKTQTVSHDDVKSHLNRLSGGGTGIGHGDQARGQVQVTLSISAPGGAAMPSRPGAYSVPNIVPNPPPSIPGTSVAPMWDDPRYFPYNQQIMPNPPGWHEANDEYDNPPTMDASVTPSNDRQPQQPQTQEPRWVQPQQPKPRQPPPPPPPSPRQRQRQLLQQQQQQKPQVVEEKEEEEEKEPEQDGDDPSRRPIDFDEGKKELSCLLCGYACCVTLWVIGLAIALGVCLGTDSCTSSISPTNETISEDSFLSDAPTASPMNFDPYNLTAPFVEELSKTLGLDYFEFVNSTESDFDYPIKARREALEWLAYGDLSRPDPTDLDLLERYILAVFYYQTSQKNWWDACGYKRGLNLSVADVEICEDPDGLINTGYYWLSGNPHCQWAGILCEGRNEGANVAFIELRK
mgnify:CR=1 FL=1